MRRVLITCCAIVLAISSEFGSSPPILAGAAARLQSVMAGSRAKKSLSIAQRIHQALLNYHFVGSVLIAQNGKVIFKHGYGRSGLRSSAAPNSARTVYNAGDVTVPLTVSAVLQLQEQGKVSFGDSICKYLSQCPAAWTPLTIENLLNCTSGIYDPIIEDSTFDPTPRTTTAQFLARAAAHQLTGAPGHPDREPCESEPIIIAAIVQTVSRESFPPYIEQHVLQPAGLSRSGILQTTMRVPGMATSYGAGHTAPRGWIDGKWSYGLMGLYTDVSDVYTWDEALLAGKIVSRSSLHAMLIKHGEGSPYGWGLFASYRGKDLIVASGETPWSTQVNAIVPSSDTVIIFLSNTSTNAPSYVTPILGLLKT